MNNKEGLKILDVEIENFKNISKMSVDFGGKSAIILGRNQTGKSSFLQAIASSMDSSVIPMEPITKGEERSTIEVVIGGILGGEKVKYTLATYFTPSNKKGRVVVMDEDDNTVSGGRAIIDSIIGNIGFDMFEFIKMGKTSTGRVSEKGVREQIDILKGLMSQEGLEALGDVEMEMVDTSDTRTEMNTEIKYLTEHVKHAYDQDELNKYSKPKDAAPVKAKMQSIGDQIEKWNKASRFKTDSFEREQELLKTIEDSKFIIQQAEQEIVKCKETFVKVSKFLEKNPTKPSIDSLTEELDAITSHNGECKKVTELEGNNTVLREKKEQYEALGEKLKGLKDKKKEVFSKFPLPVKNLAFDEDSITYDGLPLNSEQINTATLIGVGVKVSMAMNPNLKLVVIKDGSLLDKTMIDKVLKICDKFDYQVLIEKVSDESDLEVKFVEQGSK
jgi:hypothetical protein